MEKFDERPGMLEATRGLGPSIVLLHGQQPDSLNLYLVCDGIMVRLTPSEARRLAEDLTRAAKWAGWNDD
jgi:hypothetical protein